MVVRNLGTFFRNCSQEQNEGIESAEKEGGSEKELAKGKEDEISENKVMAEDICLWSITTDAGISRHTTIFTLGIPVIL